MDPRVKDTYLILESNRINALKTLTEEVIKKAKEIEKKNYHNITSNETYEPPDKRRKTGFEFFKNQQFDKPTNDLADDCSREIDAYFKESVIKKDDILDWWRNNKLRFPNLFRLIKKYLCIPATGCPSERVFSKAGEIVCKKRSMVLIKVYFGFQEST